MEELLCRIEGKVIDEVDTKSMNVTIVREIVGDARLQTP